MVVYVRDNDEGDGDGDGHGDGDDAIALSLAGYAVCVHGKHQEWCVCWGGVGVGAWRVGVYGESARRERAVEWREGHNKKQRTVTSGFVLAILALEASYSFDRN